jgi:hypothetical protein
MFKEPHLNPENLIIKRENLIIRLIDNRAVLLSPEYHHPFRFNRMGTRIWELIDSHQRVKDLIDAVTQLYDVDRKEVVRDITTFLSELLKNKLIKTD